MTSLDTADKEPGADTVKLIVASGAIICWLLFAADQRWWPFFVVPGLLISGLVASLTSGGIFYVKWSTRLVQLGCLAVVAALIAHNEIMRRSDYVSADAVTSPPEFLALYCGLSIMYLIGAISLELCWHRPLARNLGAITSNSATEARLAPRLIFVVPAGMMLLALAPLPYGYYQLLRLVTFVAGGIIAHAFWRRGGEVWAIAFGMMALLFNPILRVTLEREQWAPINVIAAGLFFAGLWAAKAEFSKTDSGGAVRASNHDARSRHLPEQSSDKTGA